MRMRLARSTAWSRPRSGAWTGRSGIMPLTGRSDGMGMPTVVSRTKACGIGAPVDQASVSPDRPGAVCAALGTATREPLPTPTAGIGATGWTTDPVVSLEGALAALSGPELEAQPANVRQ